MAAAAAAVAAALCAVAAATAAAAAAGGPPPSSKLKMCAAVVSEGGVRNMAKADLAALPLSLVISASLSLALVRASDPTSSLIWSWQASCSGASVSGMTMLGGTVGEFFGGEAFRIGGPAAGRSVVFCGCCCGARCWRGFVAISAGEGPGIGAGIVRGCVRVSLGLRSGVGRLGGVSVAG